MPCPKRRHHSRRQWRSRAGSSLPLLQRRAQPAAGGNCRVDVRARQGEFDATRRARVERGHRREPALRQGAFPTLSPQESHGRRGETRPITANRRHPKNEAKDQGLDPACAGATNRSRMPCPKRRHRTPPAMAKPSRQQPSPSAARGSPWSELSRRCLSPPGRVSTRPAGRGWSEGHCEPALRQGVLVHFRRHKKDRPGRDPANHRQPKATQTEAARIRPDPVCAGATNRSGMPCPKRRHHNPPAMAKPSRQQPSFCSAEWSPRPAGIVASMSEPARASFDATRRARVERGNRREPALRQGASLSLLCRHKKGGRLPGETRPITANRRQPENRTARISPDPAFAGRRIVSECRARTKGTTARRQWRSRAGSSLPFCSARCSPRPAGIVASMSEPARASFDATRRAERWSEGTGETLG